MTNQTAKPFQLQILVNGKWEDVGVAGSLAGCIAEWRRLSRQYQARVLNAAGQVIHR